MKSDTKKKFDKFLMDSFSEGIYCRELRLSNEEIEYLKKKYPKASLKKFSTDEYDDGKTWWEVNLLNSNTKGN